MKRDLFRMASLLFACIVLSSCEKEEVINAPDSLNGTSWMYTTEENNTAVGIELKFTSATNGEINIFVAGEEDDVYVIAGFKAGDFTYSYKKPDVTMNLPEGKSTGKIDGNKLTSNGAVFVKE